ncbi:jg16491, partial [Pararge aegeria aegeria]
MISPHVSEAVVLAHVRMISEVGDLVFTSEDSVQRLNVVGSIFKSNLIIRVMEDMFRHPLLKVALRL